MPRTIVGLSTFVALALAMPMAASAATVGQTAPTSADIVQCGGSTLFLTPASEYTVPRDGVLTSWSAQGDTAGASDELKLKVVDPVTGTTYEIVGEDPTTRAIANNTLNTFNVQIPVDEGDLLALWVGPGVHPCARTAADNGLHFRGGSHPEPGVGDLFTTDSTFGARLNASANLVTKRCKGKAPTMAGTAGNDTLLGTPGKDVIVGLGGNDTIKSRGGKDRICGNKGNDTLKGGSGNDFLKGDKGNDTLNGGGGDRDKCVGGQGDDIATKCEVERSI